MPFIDLFYFQANSIGVDANPYECLSWAEEREMKDRRCKIVESYISLYPLFEKQYQ